MLPFGNRAKLVIAITIRNSMHVKCCFNILLCFFTVLYLSSVKVCHDSYKDRPVLQAVSRSVITKDPLMMDEARHLNNHAATHLSDPEVINSILEQLEPGDTFDRNYTIFLLFTIVLSRNSSLTLFTCFSGEVAEQLFSLFALQNLMDNMEKGRKQVLLVSVVINKINLRSEICFKAKWYLLVDPFCVSLIPLLN